MVTWVEGMLHCERSWNILQIYIDLEHDLLSEAAIFINDTGKIQLQYNNTIGYYIHMYISEWDSLNIDYSLLNSCTLM